MCVRAQYSCHGQEPSDSGSGVAKINQDCACFGRPVGGIPGTAIFFVLDGHGACGHDVSHESMHTLFMMLSDAGIALAEEPDATLADAFEASNMHLRLMACEPEMLVNATDSGACACVAYLHHRQLHVASVGDCRCVLGTVRQPSDGGTKGGGGAGGDDTQDGGGHADVLEVLQLSLGAALPPGPAMPANHVARPIPPAAAMSVRPRIAGQLRGNCCFACGLLGPGWLGPPLQSTASPLTTTVRTIPTPLASPFRCRADHKCDLPAEQSRIEDKGGWVRPGQVDPEDGEVR